MQGIQYLCGAGRPAKSRYFVIPRPGAAIAMAANGGGPDAPPCRELFSGEIHSASALHERQKGQSRLGVHVARRSAAELALAPAAAGRIAGLRSTRRTTRAATPQAIGSGRCCRRVSAPVGYVGRTDTRLPYCRGNSGSYGSIDQPGVGTQSLKTSPATSSAGASASPRAAARPSSCAICASLS